MPAVAVVGDPPSPGPRLVDVSAIDRTEPWHVVGLHAARHPLSQDVPLAALLDAERQQWQGGEPVVRLPGGIPIDDSIVALVRAAIDRWRRTGEPLPPEPFSDGVAFRRWLEAPAVPWGPDIGRYWVQWRDLRPEVAAAFPAAEGVGFPAFRHWAESQWFVDGRSAILRTGAGAMRPPWSDVSREPGINLVGYLGYDKSIGDVARRIDDALGAASIAHACLDYHRSGSPRALDPPSTTTELRFDTNLCVINADQIPNLVTDHGEALLPGRRTIGYWFWEVERIPEAFRGAIETVDEIWAGSDFVADAFRAVTDRPVRTVPIPLPEPDVPEMSRGRLGLPEGRFVVLVTFDYLSVAERKNPVGAIEAFMRAFPHPSPDGPVLVVKSLNAHHRPHQAERTALAAAGRDDILLVDRHVTRAEQLAMTRSADVLLSLHRSEGLGLHLMEAMWLGTPTIATRYSGNMQFCTDDNCALVDAGRSVVVAGDGYLPPGAEWAEPDLDQAADALRRMIADDAWRRRLIDGGRSTMESQPSMAETGRLIARICDTARVGGSR
jgi:glycosyltransferase involved in cell wall biosynthesis